MIIPAYSQERFHEKVEELADLDKPLKLGYLSVNEGAVEVSCRFRFVTTKAPADTFTIAQFIDTFFAENASQIRACDLPFLGRLVSYLKKTEYSIYAKRVNVLYLENQKYSSDLQELPAELISSVVGDSHSYISLRQTCRAVYEKLPLCGLIDHVIKPAKNGSFVGILTCFDFLCMFVRQKKIEEARYVLGKIIANLSPMNQKCFWLYFQKSNFDLLSQLFDKQYPKISSLGFPSDSCKMDFDDKGKWSLFFLKVIAAFPDITYLDTGGFIDKSFLSELIGAVLTREKLQTLDIGQLQLTSPYNQLIALSGHESIKKLVVQLEADAELLQLSDVVKQKLAGLIGCLESKTGDAENAVKTMVSTCSNLLRVFITSGALFPVLPSSIEVLEVDLSKRINLEEFITTFVRNADKFESLRSIFIACRHEFSPDSPDALRDMLKNLRKLHSFKVLQRTSKPDFLKHNFWFRAVSGNRHLRSLACHFTPKNKDIQKLAQLSRKLNTVYLIFQGEYDEPKVLDVNEHSKISSLILEIKKEDGINPFMRMDSVIRACNPEELVVIYVRDEDAYADNRIIVTFSPEKDDLVLGVTMKKSFYSLGEYSRLKRLVLVGSFSWNDDINPDLVNVLTPFGGQFCGFCIDIEAKRRAILKRA
jgi:hypothetical protein